MVFLIKVQLIYNVIPVEQHRLRPVCIESFKAATHMCFCFVLFATFTELQCSLRLSWPEKI